MPKTKICKECKKKFKTIRATYCSDACNRRCLRKTKAAKYSTDFHKLKFGLWLIGECKRAQTVEILTGVNLCELHSLWVTCKKYSGFNQEEWEVIRKYELSHISPVAHPQSIGLLHPDNLVIAPDYYNRKRGTRWNGVSGKWIMKYNLQTKLRVKQTDTIEAVSKKIQKFCGSSFTDLVESKTLSKSFIHKMKDKLIEHGVDVSGLSYEEIEKQFALHDSSKKYVLQSEDCHTVFIEECERLGVIYCIGNYHIDQFDQLHGEPVFVHSPTPECLLRNVVNDLLKPKYYGHMWSIDCQMELNGYAVLYPL